MQSERDKPFTPRISRRITISAVFFESAAKGPVFCGFSGKKSCSAAAKPPDDLHIKLRRFLWLPWARPLSKGP